MRLRGVLFGVFIILSFSNCTKQKNKIEEEVDRLFCEARENSKTLEKPIHFFWKQIEPFQNQTDNLESLAKITFVKAMVYRTKRMTDSSLICLESVIGDLKKESDFTFLINIYAARDAANLKDGIKFRHYLYEAENIANRLDNPQFIADCLGAEGLFEMNMERYQNSFQYLFKADSILRSDSITTNRDYYQFLLGTGYRKLSYYPKAYDHFIKSLEICKQNNNRQRMLYVYLNLSRIYRTEHNYDQALKWQKEHLTLAKEINDTKELKRAYEEMGIIYAEMGNWDESEKFFIQSVDYARKTSIPESIAVALTNLGNFYLKKGDNKRAIKNLEEAYQIKLDANINDLSRLRSINALAKAYSKIGDFPNAEMYFSKALLLADSTESVYWKQVVKKNLSNLYIKEKRYQEAVFQLSDYLTLKEEYDQRKAEDNLQNLMVKYETREKEQFIEIQNNKLIVRRNTILATILLLVLITSVIILFFLNKRIREHAIQSIFKQNVQLQNRQDVIDSIIKEKIYNPTNNTNSKALTKLMTLLEEEQFYRQPDISLEELAKMLSTNITYASQMINKEFHCNFNTLINRYRVNFCKNEIKNNVGNKIFMKQIGFNAGFASQSTFYNAFKNEVGITPLQYFKVVNLKSNKTPIEQETD